jgi:hypothetical protein
MWCCAPLRQGVHTDLTGHIQGQAQNTMRGALAKLNLVKTPPKAGQELMKV